jgi:hypothetical protein
MRSAVSSIAAATMTKARSNAEEELLHRSLEKLSRAIQPVFVTDAGSGPQFLARLQEMPELIVHTDSCGLVDQVRRSVRNAFDYGARFVLYTEPDKEWFFEHALGAFLSGADEEIDLAVCSRDEESFRTFPFGQRETERTLNELFQSMLGIGERVDVLYGPLLFNSAVGLYLNDVESGFGWGWRIYSIARAFLEHRKVRVYEGYFPCPAHQRSEDNAAVRTHRLRQLAQNIEGLRMALENATSPRV